MPFSNSANADSKPGFGPKKGKSRLDRANSDAGLGSAPRQTILDAAQAWGKIKPYCAYQERCHSEVKEKLYGYGLYRSDVEQIISRLIEDNYLNEERFAIAYAGGHSRIKKWGKIKIARALRQKGVSAYCIKKALQAIDFDQYKAGLKKLAYTKWDLLKKQPLMARGFKCRQYLLQKGYEHDLINEVLKALED